MEQGVKLLVIACNSASSACLRDARERLPIVYVEAVPVTAYQESPSAEPDEEVMVPAGVRLWRVTLHFTVEPDIDALVARMQKESGEGA